MAVASVNESTHAIVYLVDPTGMAIYQAELPQGFFIYDMRVNGSTVYFCGSHSGLGCIGLFKYSDLITNPHLDFTHYDINPAVSSYTCLHRMVAYTENMHEKVVAVGECDYMSHLNNPPQCPDCSNPGDTVPCMSRLIVEADITLDLIKYTSSDYFDPSYSIDEVVVTDNFVALIGMWVKNNSISIHRCDRFDVLNSFCAYWYLYPVTTNEGASKIRGCRTENDEIVIASLTPDITVGSAPVPMASIVREFDLATMDNISSQMVMTNIKDEPKELLYVPSLQSIILLQNIFYPSTVSSKYSFVSLKRNPLTNYVADSWIDINTNYYKSLDLASGSQFVASGKDHCCLKDATMFDHNNMCYKIENVPISVIDNAPKNQIKLPPNFYQYTGSPQPEQADITTIALNIICY